MRYWALFAAIVAVFGLAACAPETPHPGLLQDFSHACDKVNESRVIAVEGYLRLPDSFSPGDRVELRLYPDRAFTGKPIAVDMPFGNGPNQAVRINSSYTDSDLKVRLSNDALVPFGTRVRVSGRMHYPILAADYQCELENLYLETAK